MITDFSKRCVKINYKFRLSILTVFYRIVKKKEIFQLFCFYLLNLFERKCNIMCPFAFNTDLEFYLYYRSIVMIFYTLTVANKKKIRMCISFWKITHSLPFRSLSLVAYHPQIRWFLFLQKKKRLKNLLSYLSTSFFQFILIRFLKLKYLY